MSSKEWRLVGFRRSDKKDKKIVAVLESKETGKKKSVHFGQRGSSTYQNKTGVEVDSTHSDKKRRDAYRARHKGEGDTSNKYKAGWFSWHFLWLVTFVV